MKARIERAMKLPSFPLGYDGEYKPIGVNGRDTKKQRANLWHSFRRMSSVTECLMMNMSSSVLFFPQY